MPLTLYSHPLASYCHKVLIALYENDTPFTAYLLDLGNPGEAAKFVDLWPVGKMPVLHDSDRNTTIAESSIIIEYLDQHHFRAKLLPADAQQNLDTRLWDRFCDLHIHEHMQKVVADSLRPDGSKDPTGVTDAHNRLKTAYAMLDRHMANRDWPAAERFTLADCAATPALFYASIVSPFPPDHPHLTAYFERLLARPSVQRVLAEARPFFQYFPFVADMPARFLTDQT
ncbi:MAG: glutathione S-transferase family protein [Paracoccaceae bacterium]